MSGWQAIIPLNLGRDCKTRLAGQLSRSARDQLVEAMARHVIAQVRGCARVAEVVILSPEPPPFPDVAWQRDTGAGLNVELAAALKQERTLIIHADLPLLTTADIDALIEAAERCGAAIAPDHARTGTNALALIATEKFTPAFGENSFAKHSALLPHAAIITERGLMHDVDTAEDLNLAVELGAPCIVQTI